MKKIYNEVRRFEGKLLEFADYLVEQKLYSSNRTAREAIRHNTRAIPEVDAAYAKWRPGRLRTKDMSKHVAKVAEVFKEVKVRTVKAECESIVDVLEEALKELTLAIKQQDLGKLPEVKLMLEEALYGSKA